MLKALTDEERRNLKDVLDAPEGEYPEEDVPDPVVDEPLRPELRKRLVALAIAAQKGVKPAPLVFDDRSFPSNEQILEELKKRRFAAEAVREMALAPPTTPLPRAVLEASVRRLRAPILAQRRRVLRRVLIVMALVVAAALAAVAIDKRHMGGSVDVHTAPRGAK